MHDAENISGSLMAASRKSVKEKEFWKNKLGGEIVGSSFTFDHKPNAANTGLSKTSSFAVESVKFEITSKLFSKLSWMTNESDIRLHMVLTAILSVLLHKYTGNNDIIIATPIYKQDIEGDFINTVLILKNHLEPDMTFREFLLHVRNTINEAVDNQNYPIRAIFYDLNLSVDETGCQLFDTVIFLENVHNHEYIETINYNILFSFLRTDETLEGMVEYKVNSFEKPAINRMVSQFLHLAAGLIFNVDMKIEKVNPVPPEEKEKLLEAFNHYQIHCPGSKTIPTLVEDQQHRRPDGLATVNDDQQITYRELNERAECLARLIKGVCIWKDNIVGLMVERSLEMIVGMLGILKAGGAYLPIAPDSPPGRLSYILADSAVKVLVITRSLAGESEKIGTWEGKKIILDDISMSSEISVAKPFLQTHNRGHLKSNLRMLLEPAPVTTLVYIIYTSGSSGQPKGVMVEHLNAVNVVAWFAREHGLDFHSHVLQLSAYTFDASINQIFGTLLAGGVLFLVKKEWLGNIGRIRHYIEKNDITLINFVPLFLQELLLEQPRITCLKTVISGGENLDDSLKNKFLEKGYILYNQYGPTETTIDALAARCNHDRVTLGRPILNTACYIVDRVGHLCPTGVTGELWVGGANVSRGYLNNPELTRDKFVTDLSGLFIGPLKKFKQTSDNDPMQMTNNRLYKTGDLVRLLPDNSFQFIGRIDNQVKVRGYRIELEEIQGQILKYQGIKDAVVLARDDKQGDKYLCAYIVLRNNKKKQMMGDPQQFNFKKIVKTHREFTLKDVGINADFYISERLIDEKARGNGSGKRNKNQSIVNHFEQLVKKNSDEMAIKFGKQSFTFAVLHKYANRLAQLIHHQYDDRFQLTRKERLRYNRQLLLHRWGIESQEKLKSTTLFVAGAGGIGSQILQQLSLLGFGTIIICDNDRVEFSNLNRQSLHDESRIGMNKALSAKETIKRINPNVNVIVYQDRLTAKNIDEMIGDSQIIFDCVDDLETKFVLSEAAVTRQIPHILSGMIERNSYAAILNAPWTPCFHCLHDRNKVDEINEMKKMVENYQKKPFPVAAPALFVTTGFVCNEVLKIILDFENPAYNRFFFFNQMSSASIVETDGYKQMTYSFSNHFKRICKEQGFDWEQCWYDHFVEELFITPDLQCPICARQNQLALREKIPGKLKNRTIKPKLEDKKKGKNGQQVVVSLLENPVDMVTGMLAVLKSGRIYAPLNPTLLEDQLAHLLEEIESRLILTDNRHKELAVKIRDDVNKHIPIINVNEIYIDNAFSIEKLNPKISMDQAAYISFQWNSDFEDNPLTIPRLKEYLSQTLPEYMIPNYFVEIAQVPLNQNGKIDRKALPGPKTGKTGENYAAAKDWVEHKLAGIWSEILGIEKNKISMSANFFDLGGHSLRATSLISKMNKELNVRLPLAEIFRTPTIRGLAGIIKVASEDRYTAIQPSEKKEYYSLSSMQSRLYILQQNTEDTVYNIPQFVQLEETIVKEKLEAITRQLTMRHESLRTSFQMVNNQPVQRIHSEMKCEIEYSEITPGKKKDTQSILDTNMIITNFIRSFDLSRVPLFRVGVIKTLEKKFILMVDMHHIISDGVSNNILIQDFNSLYAGTKLTPLKLQYRDYSEWLNKPEQLERIKKYEDFWIKEFDGEIPILDLPIDYPRPTVQHFEGKCLSFELETGETKALNNLARSEDVTLFMVLISVFNILLSKISNQEDIIIGTPIAGRRHSDLEHIIGLFINTLALRNFPAGERNFKEFLQDVKQRTLNAFENQEYQFEDLVEKVLVNRDPARNPLFDVMFAVQNMVFTTPIGNEAVLGRSYQDMIFENPVSRFDMSWTCMVGNDRLFISVEYCTKLFKEESILKFIDYFKKIVSAITGKSSQWISKIEIMSEDEKQKVLYDFNRTKTWFPAEKAVHEMFEEHAAITPNHAAVIFEDLMLTYRELDTHANQLAKKLITRNLKYDSIVGIMMERSVEMIIGVLGILKSGGAYLPIDPDYPGERINYMLNDSGAGILVTTRPLAEKIETVELRSWGDEVIFMEYPPVLSTIIVPGPISITGEFFAKNSSCSLKQLPVIANSLAYIIYTSGSTGRPKGIMVEHYSVVNLIYSQRRFFGINDSDFILQFSSLCFDASVEQIFIALSSGSALVLISKEAILDLEKFEKYISTKLVTHIHAVPSFLNNMKIKSPGFMKRIISGGDICHSALARKWNQTCDFFNEYGPTETTVTSIQMQIKPDDKVLPVLPIGKGIGNTFVYVLDKLMQPVPLNVIGELVIGGDGVTRGYLNNPELTSEKFRIVVNRPWLSSPGIHGNFAKAINQRFYFTGDLARWLPDGNIEFHGRIDYQVKIRGFRIELGEIESQLLDYPGTKEVVVIIRAAQNQDNYLCAYIVTSEQMTSSELREYLSKKVPDYMLPSYFVFLESIPLTPNGKVHRKALPDPQLKTGIEYTAPRNEEETRLVEIWADLLEIQTDTISIDSNFFELGGHSLKATIFITKVNKELNIRLPLTEFFRTPTIRQLAEYFRNERKEVQTNTDEYLVLLKKHLTKAKQLFFIHDGSGEVDIYMEFCKQLDIEFNCWGIRADVVDNYAPQNTSIEEIAVRYLEKIKNVQEVGPFHIAAWSLGGTIAFEIASQLEALGENLSFLGLIDSPGPQENWKEEVIEFSLESEKGLLSEYFPGNEIKAMLSCMPGINEVWTVIVNHIVEKNFSVEFIRKLIPHHLAQIIPNYNHLGINELIHYLNINRTLINARLAYIPSQKINANIHYFKASESPVIFRDCWNDYCMKPVKSFEIPGDHLTILKKPNVIQFAKIVEKELNKMV